MAVNLKSDAGPRVADGRGALRTGARVCTLCILAVYLTTFLLLPHDGFWINDNGCKFIQLQGMIATDYQDFAIPWSGHELDPHYYCDPLPSPFGYLVKGKLYGAFSPVFALLSSFPYRLLGFAGLYVLPLMGGLLTLPAVWLLTGLLVESGTTRRIAQPLAVVVVAFATPMWFYSVTFWEHTPAVCLATWSIVWWLGHRKAAAGAKVGFRVSSRGLIPAAVLSAGAVYFRDELYLLAAILGVLTLQHAHDRWRHLFVFAGVFTVAMVPLWLFQWVALGHPVGHHLSWGNVVETDFMRHILDRGSVVSSLLLNAHGNLWISVAVAAPFLILGVTRPRVSDRVLQAAVVLLAGYACVGGLLVMLGHLTAERPIWWLGRANGLFAASPILILAFVGAKRMSAGDEHDPPRSSCDPASHALWQIVVIFVILYFLLTPERHASGIHWGCRYLLPLFPLMGVLACVTFARWWVNARRGVSVGIAVLAVTFGLSVGEQVYSLTLLDARKRFSAELNRRVLDRPEEIILASGWYIPQEISHAFFQKKVFLCATQRLEARLLRSLRAAGHREVLRIASPPARDAGRAGSEILDDGGLNFISVELRPIRLDE